MNLGHTKASIRTAKNLSQVFIAEKANITQAYLSQIENNKKLPNIETLSAISKVLEIPLPIIFFISIDENDLPEKKIEAFKTLQPLINNLIKDLYLAP